MAKEKTNPGAAAPAEKAAGDKAPAKKPAQNNPAPQAKGPAASDHCKFEDCAKKKAVKFGFCDEHYDLYMSGVIRGDGKKPMDYTEKLGRYLQQKGRKVA